MLHMMVFTYKIKYRNGPECFPNFDAFRTVKHTHGIYTNDRYHGLCFPPVYIKVGFGVGLIT